MKTRPGRSPRENGLPIDVFACGAGSEVGDCVKEGVSIRPHWGYRRTILSSPVSRRARRST
jgi:hypothetical protein